MGFALLLLPAGAHADPLGSLERLARHLERSARVVAYDGTPLYKPTAGPGYPETYVADFAYMVEGTGLPTSDVRAEFAWLARRQIQGLWPNRCLPDGGCAYTSAYGGQPATDTPQFMVSVAYNDWRKTGSLHIYRRYRENLLAGMGWLPVRSGLVYIDPHHPHSGYGFEDMAAKTGYDAFSSVLYIQAARRLAKLERASVHRMGARRWAWRARRSVRQLQRLTAPNGLLYAASIANRIPDIWASTFAAYTHAIPHAQALRVSRYLDRNYRGLVVRGQVRHLPPGVYWGAAFVRDPGPGSYQDGAYWGTASGWFAWTLSLTDRPKALRMVRNLAHYLWADGSQEAYVPDPGARVRNRHYVVSAALPVQAIKRLSRSPASRSRCSRRTRCPQRGPAR